MQNRHSLSTVAFLSVLWEKEKQDYLDLIIPFVLRCMPQNIDEQINADIITNILRAKYGFSDIPRLVVDKIVTRLVRTTNNRPKYLKRIDHKYYVDRLFDCDKFDRDRDQMRQKIDYVLQDLSSFLEKNYIHRKIDHDQAYDFLFHFFETYGLTIMRNAQQLRFVTSTSGEHNFYVARYILEQMDGKTDISDQLIDITKGFLISKAVYFYSNDIKSSVGSKLRNVKVFLDCSLIIDCLGYDTSSDENAIDELIHLIKLHDGQVSAFSHTVDEAGNLLDAYAVRIHMRNAFSLSGLEAKGYSPELIRTLASPSSIEKILESKNVVTVSAPSYDGNKSDVLLTQYAGFQDEQKIRDKLESYGRHNNHGNGSSRISFDIKSLSAIGRIRKDTHPKHIEKCVAILATQDWTLTRCMHDLYPDEFPPEVDFAIRDIDIMSLLWLSQYNKESQLPRHILLANVFAACNVSSDIMNKAIELTNKMENDKAIGPDAALMFRSTTSIKPLVFERTHNNPQLLNETLIRDIIGTFIIDQSSAGKQLAVDAAIMDTTNKMQTQYNSAIIERDTKLAQATEEIRQNKNKMRNNAENKAQKHASTCKKLVKRFLDSVCFFCIAISIYCWVTQGISSSNWGIIILSVLGLLQILDYLTKIINLSGKIPQIVYDKVFSWRYAKELKKCEEISGFTLSI